MLMGMFMRVSGVRIKLTDTAHICTWMALNTKVSGRMTNSTAEDLRHGQMVHRIGEVTLTERKKDKATLFGLMGRSIPANSRTITSKAEVFTCGTMEECSMDFGRTTKWKVMVSLPGLMVDATLDNMRTIKSKEKVYSLGRTEECTTVNGSTVSSMVSDCTPFRAANQKQANGKMANEFVGCDLIR